MRQLSYSYFFYIFFFDLDKIPKPKNLTIAFKSSKLFVCWPMLIIPLISRVKEKKKEPSVFIKPANQ